MAREEHIGSLKWNSKISQKVRANMMQIRLRGKPDYPICVFEKKELYKVFLSHERNNLEPADGIRERQDLSNKGKISQRGARFLKGFPHKWF